MQDAAAAASAALLRPLPAAAAIAFPKPAPAPPPPPLAAGGERKHVTILFADVRGSTAMVRQLDPEQVLARLDPVVQGLRAAIARYGGIVNEVQGDGVMALFGAPLAAEDHPVRACLAARAILADLPPGIAMRIGIHVGEVVVRPSGRDASDYQATGPAVYLAKRLEQAADPGTARLSEEAARLTRGYTTLRPLGPVDAKGWDEPIPQFELLDATDRPSWEVRSANALSPFVGRDAEMAVLRTALGRASFGRAQAVLLVADAGVGKSRLVHEFLRGCASAAAASGARNGSVGTRVLRAAAAAHADTAPFHVAAELMRSWIGAAAEDDQAAIGRRLSQALALSGAADADEAALRSLLALPFSDPGSAAAWAALTPVRRREHLLAASRRAILREAAAPAAEGPVVLIVEDLHWADEPSRALLHALVAGAGSAKLLLIATTRPEHQPDWAGRSGATVLHLEPLDPGEAETMLRRLVGEEEELAPLRARILARAEGTPLFLEEIAHALRESGAVAEAPARRWLALPAGEVLIPTSVQAIVAARVDRLQPLHRTLLQAASVIGKDVRTDLLRAVIAAGQSEDALAAGLAALRDADFLYETSLGTGEEHTFKHAVTQAIAYGTLLRSEQRAYHARALHALELLAGDRTGEVLERLSDHATSGEVWEAAHRYGRLAGLRANERYAWLEAVTYFDRALDALARQPRSREAAQAGIELRLALRVALAAIGDFRRVVEVMDEARALAEYVGDPVRVAQMDGYACMVLTSLGALEEAVQAGRRGAAAAAMAGDGATTLNLRFALGQAYWFSGAFAEAAATLEASLPAVRGPLRLADTGTNGTASVLTLVCLSKTYAMMGRFEAALALGGEAEAIAAETGRPYDVAYASIARGFAHMMMDAHEEAAAVLGQGLDVARRAGILLLLPSIARYLGRAHAAAGRGEEARILLDEALGHAREQRLAGLEAWCGAALGHAHLDSDAAQAEAALRDALELAARHGYRPVQVHCLRALAGLQAGSGDPEAAEAGLRRASELARGMGMRPDLAAIHRSLATLLRAQGRVIEAAEEDALADASTNSAPGAAAWPAGADNPPADDGGNAPPSPPERGSTTPQPSPQPSMSKEHPA